MAEWRKDNPEMAIGPDVKSTCPWRTFEGSGPVVLGALSLAADLRGGIHPALDPLTTPAATYDLVRFVMSEQNRLDTPVKKPWPPKKKRRS